MKLLEDDFVAIGPTKFEKIKETHRRKSMVCLFFIT